MPKYVQTDILLMNYKIDVKLLPVPQLTRCLENCSHISLSVAHPLCLLVQLISCGSQVKRLLDTVTEA